MMMNSKNKLYKCIICGKMVPIRSKGKCPQCREREVGQPTLSSIRKVSEKRLQNLVMNGNKKADFFKVMVETATPISQESGARIGQISAANICHILPKRTYKSIAEDKENIVILTIEEHSLFDKLLDTRDLDGLLINFPNTCNIIKERLPYLSTMVVEKGSLLSFLHQI